MENRQLDDVGFWAWFDQARSRENISVREVERRGGTPRGRIGNARSGNWKPTFEICQSVAAGLRLPVKDVLKVARLVPPAAPAGELEETLVVQFRQLPIHDQRLLAEMVQALVEKRRAAPTPEHEPVIPSYKN